MTSAKTRETFHQASINMFKRIYILSCALAFSMSLAAEQLPVAKTWSLFCQDDPAKSTCEEAFPTTLEGAMLPYILHHELDANGEGIVWKMANWLELHNPPRRNDRTGITESFEFRATAHMAVFREFWTYENGPGGKIRKKDWVRRTVAHITAGGTDESAPIIRVSGSVASPSRPNLSSFDAAAQSNVKGAHPVTWKGETLGWIAVSWSARKYELNTDARWMKAGLNDSMAKASTNFSENYKYEAGLRARNQTLRWGFAVWPSDTQVDPGFKWPASRPDFKIPPLDKQ